jgi:hypothetical protein
MKKRLTLFALLAWCYSFGALAQTDTRFPLDSATQRITYTEVVQVPGASKAELYTRAKLWFANTFNSAKAVIEADEKDAGIVQGDGHSQMAVHYLGPKKPASSVLLWYTVKIACKDGRYRYEITKLRTAPPSEPTNPQYTFTVEETRGKAASMPAKYGAAIAEFDEQVHQSVVHLRELMQIGMAKPAAGTSAGKSDW